MKMKKRSRKPDIKKDKVKYIDHTGVDFQDHIKTIRFNNRIITPTDLMRFLEEIDIRYSVPSNVSFIIDLPDGDFKRMLPEKDKDLKTAGFVKNNINIILVNQNLEKE